MKSLVKSLLIISLICSHFGYSQYELPDFVPRSPEAAKIGRFGQVPLNSSTGQMNFAVPIVTIEAGGSTWPVSLNYNYGGLLLEGKPSLCGLGWSLFAGGAVNREVRGLPDESQYGYYGSQHQRALINTYVQTGNTNHLSYTQYDNFLNNRYDGQPDKYTVNVAGLNFSFKVDVNQNAVFLSKHDNIVNLTWANNGPGGSAKITEIEVIDDKGITYIFDKVEESIPDDEAQYDFAQVDLSWLLTEVKYPNQQKITLSYTPDTHISYDFSAQGAATYADVQDPHNDPSSYYVYPGYSESTHSTIINRHILTGITFPSGSVTLNLTSRGSNREVYQSIQVKNSQNNTVDNLEFTYQGNRDALVKIRKNGIDYYEFRYYGVNEPDENSPFGIPNFLNSEADKARNKDKWQFFNGAGNQFALSVPNSPYIADNDPSYLHTKLGAMTRITYPTKGYTKISYEQNEIKTQNVINSSYYNSVALSSTPRVLRLDGQSGNFGAPATREVQMRIRVEHPTVAIVSHITNIDFDSGTGHFFMSMNREDGACPYSSYYPEDFSYPNVETDYDTYANALRGAIQSYNSSAPESDLNASVPAMCPKLAFEIGPDGPYASQGGVQTVSGNSGGRILLLPGVYIFKIGSLFYKSTDGYAQFSVRLQADLGAPPPYVNKVVGGIRVQKLEDYSSQGAIAQTQHFEYNDEDDFSTAVENLTPLNRKIGSIEARYSYAPYITYTEFYSYLFDSYTAYNPAIGTPVYYSQIKRYVENENSQGSTTTNYAYTGIFNTPTWHKIPQGEHFNKGRVVQVLTKKGTGGSILRELDTLLINTTGYNQKRDLIDANTFQDLNPNHPPSLIVGLKQHRLVRWDLHSYPTNTSNQTELNAIMALSDFIVYKELDSWYQMGSEKTTEYRDDKKVIKTNFYKYQGDDFLKLTSTESIDHSSGEEYITRYTYPEDVSNEPHMNTLIAKNQVTTPVKTERFIIPKDETQEKLLESSRTTFESYTASNGQTMILPKELKAVKGGSYSEENRIIYEDYDGAGNLRQYRQVGGPPITIIWGYNSMYPVAKVENATYSQVTATGVNLTTLNSAGSSDTSKRAELQKIRAGLPNALVSTYTYEPMVGVNSMTDPRGHTVYYEYDNFNRLEFVKEQEPNSATINLIKEHKYNYKNQ